MGNKVKYNLKNVHAAKLTKSDDGTFSLCCAEALSPALSAFLWTLRGTSPFYADSIVYFRPTPTTVIPAIWRWR